MYPSAYHTIGDFNCTTCKRTSSRVRANASAFQIKYTLLAKNPINGLNSLNIHRLQAHAKSQQIQAIQVALMMP